MYRLGSPLGYALEQSHIPYASGAGRALESLGATPVTVASAPKKTGKGAIQSVAGIVEAPYGAYKMHHAGVGWGDVGGALLKAFVDDYKRRYGKNWIAESKKEPFSQLMDALIPLGLATRGLAMGDAASRLKLADMPASLRNVLKETARPGIISRGEEIPRLLSYDAKAGKGMTSVQSFSRSPLRRGLQGLADEIAQGHLPSTGIAQIDELTGRIGDKIPDFPLFGARSRVTRANGMVLRRTIDRLLSKVPHTEALNALSRGERTRLFWGAQIGDHSATGLRRLKDALTAEYEGRGPGAITDSQDFNTWLAHAKRLGFGQQVLKRLDEGIRSAEKDAGKFESGMSPKYERAVQAMEEATNLSEQVLRDNEGFSTLKNDIARAHTQLEGMDPNSAEAQKITSNIADMQSQLAQKSTQLDQIFGSRRGRLLDWMYDTELHSSPERNTWMQVLPRMVGGEQAQQLVKITDARAIAERPENPASYWRDRIGMPQGKTPDQLTGDVRLQQLMMGQTHDWTYGERPLIEGQVEAPDAHTIFYSPLQRAVGNLPERMQAGQLRAEIQKAIPPEEWRNTGLDNFFGQYSPNEVIPTQELQNFMANPLNAYNLREVHFLNHPDAGSYLTRYEEQFQGTYVSRDPRQGEYHEVVFELPSTDSIEYVGKQYPYLGKGYHVHWGRQNVAVHFRFHVFEEDGVKKLLIEEIQSDWANDFRTEGRHLPSPDLNPDETIQFNRHRADVEFYDWEMSLAKERLRQATAEAERAAGGPLDPGELDRITAPERRAIEEAQSGLDYARTAMTDLNKGKLSGYPYPPLGRAFAERSSYANSPIRWLTRYAAENGVDQIISVPRETQMVRNGRLDLGSQWHSLADQGVDAQEVTDIVQAHLAGRSGRSYLAYDQEIPAILERELGVKGTKVHAAYEGHYRQPFDYEKQIDGRMPGWVFDVTEEAKANAMRPRSLYQRQPNWETLPKGATEFLANGNTILHMFERGDVSTWIHELGHIALYDLKPEQLSTIEEHLAAGRKLANWTDMDHERFARAFERYVRDGVAPTQELQSTFQSLMTWIKQVWLQEGTHIGELHPEVKNVFDSLFSKHEPDVYIPHRAGEPNLVGARTSRGIPRAGRALGDATVSRIPLFKQNRLGLVRTGLIHDDPRATIEHVNRVVMLARANQLREAMAEMGTKLEADSFPNFQTQYVVKKVGRGVDTPLFDALESSDNPEEVVQMVKKNMDSHFAVNEEDYRAKLANEWKGKQQLYTVDKKLVDSLFKNVTGKTPGATTAPKTAAGKIWDATLDSVRALLLYANPGFYVANMVGNAIMGGLGFTRPQDAVAIGKDLAWSFRQAQKAAVRENTADPLWNRITVEMGRGPTSGGLSFHPSVLGRKGESVRQAVKDRPQGMNRRAVIKEAMRTREPGTAGRVAEAWSHGLGNWGRRSGHIIDDSWRVAAWKSAARKRGFDTDEKIAELLDDASGSSERMMDAELKLHRGEKMSSADRAEIEKQMKAKRELNAIRDEAEQLMLDFDSMTPFERDKLTRTVFLYPFLKASVKYPYMFATERPLTTGALGQAAFLGEQFATQPGALGARPDVPAWMEGYARGPGGWWPLASVSPFAAGLNVLQSGMALGGLPEIGVQTPFEYLNPLMQLGIELGQGRNKFGQEKPASEILRQDMPAPTWLRYWWKRPSNIYQQRHYYNALLRSLRGPFTTNASALQQQSQSNPR